MDEIIEQEHLEKTGQKNIRMICYDLLKDVRFAGEPVVPRITSNKKEHKLLGVVFSVEKLRGVDLADFLLDEGVQLKDKLGVLLHVTQQLRQIDEAGYVLFDRHGGNVRVLKWGGNRISTRQVDIEDMYNRESHQIYSLDGSWDVQLIKTLKSRGVDLWVNAVSSIALQGIGAAERSGNHHVPKLLSKHVWDRAGGTPKGSNLSQLEKAIGDALESVV